MKRILSFMVAFFVTIGCIVPSNVMAKQPILQYLPKIGEIVSGFKTIEIGTIDIINSKTALFEHEKSGAKLIYIQNDDKNRAFDISFKTPALDSTGVNHVLEHATVSGSEKYPFKNILFTVLNQTYSTFINAFTAPNYTTYPVASMSEAQLLKFTDMYMDCVFNPYIYEDEKIFDREAWRYEKADKDTPISINGTVYSEMKGSVGNIQTSAFYNTLDALFPNSIVSNVSGGNPEDLLKLTYEQMIETHDTYYKPSNALITLYGDLDYKTFLEHIDKEYLSKYDKEYVVIETGKIKPLKELVTKIYDFPVASTTNTQNSSQIDYSYAMTGLSDEENIGMMLVASILNHDASQLKQAFKESDIGASISVSFSSTFPQPFLTFTVQNTDESKMEDLKELVDTCMKDIIKYGFDNKVVDAVIASDLFSNSVATETQGLGYNVALVISSWWATYDNVDYFNIVIDGIESVKEKIKDNYFQDLIQKYIMDNNHKALIATVPKAGLAEEKEKEFNDSLKAKEDSMTDEEIQKLIDNTKEFNTWNSTEVDQEKVKDLQAVTISELPEEIRTYDITDKTIDGIRYLSSNANVDKTIYTGLLFDTSAVPSEKLHYLKLFSNLLGNIRTKKYDLSELNILNTRYLNNFYQNLSFWKSKIGEEYNTVLEISWLTLKEDYAESAELLKEILFNTKLDNIEEMKNIIKSLKSNFKSVLTQNPLDAISIRNVASYNEMYNYVDYVNNIEYYKFLNEIEKLLQTSPEKVTSELESVRDIVLSKTNLITQFAGNKNNTNLFYNAMDIITKDLPANKVVKQNYSNLPRPSKSEGFVLDSTIQYNMISASYEDMGTEFNGKYVPLMLALSENYLTPKLRYQNGVYSNIEQVDKNFILMATYYDPLVKETFDVYKDISEFVKNYDIKQEDLDRYIMKAFGNYTIPSGELKSALNAINERIQGITKEDKLKILKEIKSATVEDFRAMGDMFDNISEKGSISTIGNLNKLKENSDLYENIISIEIEN